MDTDRSFKIIYGVQTRKQPKNNEDKAATNTAIYTVAQFPFESSTIQQYDAHIKDRRKKGLL